MEKVDLPIRARSENELARELEAIYRKTPQLDRKRHVIVQCANCTSYWRLDTWTEAIPCEELNPWCDQVAYCPDCYAQPTVANNQGYSHALSLQ